MKFILTGLLFFSTGVMAHPSEEDLASVPEVMMNHYLVASVKEFSAIQTYGVATCVAVMFYDRHHQVGAIMHVSASTDIEKAIQIVLNDLELKAGAEIKPKVTLIGGWDDSMGEDTGLNYESDRMVSEILAELNKEKIQIILNDTLISKEKVEGGYPAVVNIEMDLKTGEVYYYEQSESYSGGDISVPMPELSNQP